jgi:YVTN family beta-propeller protein
MEKSNTIRRTMHYHRLRSTLFVIAPEPGFIATLAAQPYAYVSSLASNNLSVVNTKNTSVVASIQMPLGVTGVAVTPDGSWVYVASQTANVVSVVSTSSNSIAASIPVCSNPTQLAVSPNGSQVYVLCQGSNQVAVIDTGSNSVITTIPVGSRPCGVVFSHDGSRAYVSNLWDNNVTIIDANSRNAIGNFWPGNGPSGMAVTGDGRIYVANEYAGTVTVHDASGNLQTTIGGMSFPNWVAITPDGSRAYVTNRNGNSVAVISTSDNSVIGNIGVGSLPSSVAIMPDGRRAYVTNQYAYSVSVIDMGSNSVSTIDRIGVYPVVVATQPAFGGGSVQSYASLSPAPAPNCTPNISAKPSSFGSGGGSGNINVSLPSGCSWNANSNSSDWISITGGGSGNGNGTVSFSVNANGSTGQRSGSITVAGQQVSITEGGISCSYALSYYSASINAGGGGGSVNVNAPSGCSWNATSNNSDWISITGGWSGNGGGTVLFAVNGNGSTGSRSGSITIAGQQITLNQGGIYCSYVLSSSGGSLDAGGGNGSVNLAAPAGCTWTASTDSAWLNISSSTSGAGSTTVSYSAAPNSGTSNRSGNLYIGGQTFNVTQGGTPGGALSGPPSADSASVNGSTLTLTYSTPIGDYNNLAQVHTLINGGLNAPASCWVRYDKSVNGFYLVDDSGYYVLDPLPVGSSGTLHNSQCTLNGAGSSVHGSGGALTMTLNLTFSSSFSGTRSIYLYAADDTGLNSSWQYRGSVNVP